MSHAQTMDALEQANAVRVGRAQIHRNIAAQSREGALRLVASLLCDCTSVQFGAFTVERLLRSCPNVGPVLTGRMLAGVPVRPNKLVRDLTPRQREALAGICESQTERRTVAGARSDVREEM